MNFTEKYIWIYTEYTPPYKKLGSVRLLMLLKKFLLLIKTASIWYKIQKKTITLWNIIAI